MHVGQNRALLVRAQQTEMLSHIMRDESLEKDVVLGQMYGSSHFASLISSGNELPAAPCEDHVKYRHFIYGDVHEVAWWCCGRVSDLR